MKQQQINLKSLFSSIFGAPVKGVDCGDAVSRWMSEFLYEGRREVRVLYRHPQMDRRVQRHEGLEFPQFLDTDKVGEWARGGGPCDCEVRCGSWWA